MISALLLYYRPRAPIAKQDGNDSNFKREASTLAL